MGDTFNYFNINYIYPYTLFLTKLQFALDKLKFKCYNPFDNTKLIAQGGNLWGDIKTITIALKQI
jgi:hypothetical protein